MTLPAHHVCSSARNIFLIGVVSLVASLAARPVIAFSIWNGLASPDNKWSTSGNWDNNTIPGAGDTAQFDNAGNGNTTVSLNGTQAINTLLFDSANVAAYTIGQNGADVLNFDSGGLLSIDLGVTTPQTFNATVATNGSGLLAINSVPNGATTGNGVVGLTFGPLSIGGTLTVTQGAASVTTVLGGNIGDAPSQVGSLTLDAPTGGAGNNSNFVINGNNTYTGGTTIKANTGTNGAIYVGSDSAFGTGKITTQTSAFNAEIRALGGTRTISNAIELNQGLNFAGSNSLVLAGPISIGSGSSRLFANKMIGGPTLTLSASPGSSNIYLGNPTTGAASTLIFSVVSGATTIINSQFQDVNASDPNSAVRYTTATGGNIIINALQTYTSPTQLGDGSATVQFHHDYNLGDPSGPFGLGTLVANGGSNIQLAPTGGGTRIIANPIEMKFGFTIDDVTGDTTSLTFTSPITFTSTASRLLQNTMPSTGGTLTLGSATSPSTFTLASTAGLTLTFQGGGKTVINDVIQDSPGVPMNITINTATAVTFNGPLNTNGVWSIGTTTGVANAKVAINALRTGTGNTTFSGSGSAALIGISSNALPGPSFTAGPFGSGTVTMNNTTVVPTLQPIGADRMVANAIAMTSGFTVSNATGTTFNLNLTGPITLGATGQSLTNNLASGAALTLGDAGSPSTLSLGSTLTFQTATAGGGMTIINDAITGTGGLTVQNSAVVQMNGANNDYSGTTAVTGTGTPKLLVNGAKTGTGQVLIDTTGTLGGTGSIAGDVGNGGTIAPGTSVGTLTMSGNVTMGANSHLAIELSGASADKLVVGGNLNLSAAEFLDVTGLGSGPSWLIATYAGTRTGTFDSVTTGYAVDYSVANQIILKLAGDYNGDGIVDAADYAMWRKNPDAFGGDPGGYDTWRANFGHPPVSGNGSGLVGGSVPEPAGFVLAALGLLMGGTWRCRKIEVAGRL